MDESNASMRCEQCGRDEWMSLAECPDRPAGRCPYTLIAGRQPRELLDRRLRVNRLLVAIGAGALIGSAAVWWLIFRLFLSGEPLLIAALPAILTFLAIMLIASRLLRTAQLVNRQTGALWQRVTFAGSVLEDARLDAPEPFEFDPPAERLPDLPFSILALPDESWSAVARSPKNIDYAIDALRLALVGLCLRGYIRLYRAAAYYSRRGAPMQRRRDLVFFAEPCDRAQPAEGIDGVLEQRLFSVIRSAPHPLTIWEVIRALYGSDEELPAGWLLRQIVEDAESRKLTWWDRSIGGFDAQQDAGRRLVEAALRPHPDVQRALDLQLVLAIASRQASPSQ